MERVARIGKTLALGAMGGVLFTALSVPLPWMLGAMVATTVAALSGRKLEVPFALRALMFPVLGVMLGATFTPDLLDQIASWPVTLGALALYLPVTVGLLYLYFRFLVKFDRPTAYFCAVPGGFSEMVVVGAEMGADVRSIGLVHASRILLTVLIVPLAFASVGQGGTTIPGESLLGVNGPDMMVLLAAAVVGYVVGGWLRLPAYRMVGPLIASAVVHVAGFSTSTPPFELVALAQVVVGAYVGARFTGIAIGVVIRTLTISVGATAIMLTLMVAFVAILEHLVDIEFAALILAFAPGGFPEMSLIALAIGTETAFVATHHFVRVLVLVFSAPLVFRAMGLDRKGQPAED
jgi:membrane AbrB-like protein